MKKKIMKKLVKNGIYAICILLLTCTFCLAQNTSNDVYLTKTVKLCNDSTELCVGGAGGITAKLLIAYEKECYNDSTYVEYFKYNESPSVTDSVSGLIVVYDVYYPPTFIKEWQHKEPTFKDFLAWVRKKYGL